MKCTVNKLLQCPILLVFLGLHYMTSGQEVRRKKKTHTHKISREKACEPYIEQKVVLRLEDVTCEGRAALTVYSKRGG